MDNHEDSLDFIRDIRIAQFWRDKLGDIDYGTYNPADLRRWYEAMELRGPDEIRSYLYERAGRYPSGVVTGIVPVAPHPRVMHVNIWLESQERVRTAPVYVALTAFGILSFFTMTYLNSCSNYQSPNIVARIPQPAVLLTGSLSGSPPPISTAPQFAPGVPVGSEQTGVEVQGYQPAAPAMTAQSGTGFAAPVGTVQIGTPSAGGPSPTGLSGGSLGGQSQGQPSTIAPSGMHTANTGNSYHAAGLGSSGQ